MADDFSRLDPWIQEIASRFDARTRLKINRRIGMVLRQINARRIAANTQPDGAAMEPRKPRQSVVKDKVRKSGKMFKRIRLAKNMQIKAHADQVELRFDSKVASAAEVHHFGLRDRIGRFQGAPTIRYPSRQLLGLGPEDEASILDEILKVIEG